jgi:hypothetical protein
MVFRLAALAAVFAIVAQPGLAQKKVKTDPGLAGCWTRSSGGAGVDLCFGPGGRLRHTTSVGQEGFGGEGLYRSWQRGVVQLLGFPGEAWPSRSPMETCRFAFDAAADTMTFADCGLAGTWRRLCRKLDAELSCD